MKTIINSESNRPAPHAWRALCLAAAFLLGFAVLPVSANRLAYFRTVPNTDFTSAGVGAMRDTGSGVITLAGVTGAVTRAYLYWAGPMNSINPTADAIVTVNNRWSWA